MAVDTQSVKTSVASIHTRPIQNLTHEQILSTTHIPDEFKIDVKPFINRPFFVEEVKWDVSKAKWDLLATTASQLPRDIISSNPTIANGLKIGSLYRMSCQLNVSVAGTITHSGCLLVGLIPPLNVPIPTPVNQQYLINTILSGPHGFLFANEATSVLLDVPWYCNTDLDSLDFEASTIYKPAINLGFFPANFATLVILVVNPLQPSAGSSTTLSLVIECNFKNLEISVPTPRYVTYFTAQSYFKKLGTSLFDSAAGYAKNLAGDAIDGLRQGITYYTGLHNPNTPALKTSSFISNRNRQNNIDSQQFFENLDPNAYTDRIVQEPIFNNLIDEMAISHIISKKQFLGTIRVNQNDPVGYLLFTRPISPYQGGVLAANGAPIVAGASAIVNNIELMHLYTRAWKGTIKIHIQSVMNNKQQVKLRLLQMYNPSSSILAGYPTYRTILQAPSHLMEFTAGGQEQVIELPYLCRNKIMLSSRDSAFESLFHGQYYIYVAQPLANSTDSPQDIFFNIYMSLSDDFTFYGYSTELASADGPVNTVGPAAASPIVATATGEYKPQSLEVMNSPQLQHNEEQNKVQLHEDLRLTPLIDVRPLIRRVYCDTPFNVTLAANAEQKVIYNLDNMIGENNVVQFNPATILSKMYYGKHIGIKARFRIKVPADAGFRPLNVKIFFMPTHFYPSTNVVVNTVTAVASIANSASNGYGVGNNSPAFPLNNVTISNISNQEYLYEVTIPNTNPFKFIGGPRKLTNNVTTNLVATADSDFGDLVLTLGSTVAGTITVTPEIGFTDETRLGFHSIAPRVFRFVNANGTLNTPFLGSLASQNLTPPVALNPFLYFTRR